MTALLTNAWVAFTYSGLEIMPRVVAVVSIPEYQAGSKFS